MNKVKSFLILIAMAIGLIHAMSTSVKVERNPTSISLQYIVALADGSEEDEEEPPDWPPPGQPIPPPDTIPPGTYPVIYFSNY